MENNFILEIKTLLSDELQAVDSFIEQHLSSELLLIDQLGHHIIHSGGKRLRPILVLLSARCFKYQGDKHIPLAALVEFIHTATLLHDDVVDESELRRGNETANAIWGNEASVLVGDFLFSRSFQIMVDVGSLTILRILSDVTNTLASGEVMQLMNCHQPDTAQETYMQVIEDKTASLFAAASQIGAIISEQPQPIQQAMYDFGLHLGLAFQLVDDALDYSSDADTLGKNIGDDLAEGKPTLPLIHAIKHGSEPQRKVIQQAIVDGGLEQLASIQETIASTKAIEYTYELAKTHVDKAKTALQALPESDYRQALLDLADFALARKS